MSLILEALQRSERERRRQQTPDWREALISPSKGAPSGTGLGLGIVLGVVTAAAIAAGLWRWQAPRPVDAVPTAAPPPPMTPASSAPSPSPTAHPALAAPASPEVAVPAATPPKPIAPPSAAPTTAPIGPSAASELPRPPEATNRSPPTATPVDLPTPPAPALADNATRVSDLLPAERQQLPPLRLSMHVYNDDPARRVALIDGQRLREGDAIAPGLWLEAIERDGLRLRWQGRALRLDRP